MTTTRASTRSARPAAGSASTARPRAGSAAAAGATSRDGTAATDSFKPGHPSRLEIDVRSSKRGTFTVFIPDDFSLASDALDRVMEICSRHFPKQDESTGGPELPPQP